MIGTVFGDMVNTLEVVPNHPLSNRRSTSAQLGIFLLEL